MCSLKFIVSGEKLIKQRAFEMRMTKGYFRSFGASDVDDGRDNVDCDWRQCDAHEYSRTPRRAAPLELEYIILLHAVAEGGKVHY